MKFSSIFSSLVLVSSITASAALIPGLDTGPLQVAMGAYAYNYSVEITGGERLDPVATDGVSCPTNNGTLVQCTPAGTFFTIYDVAGFLMVTSMPAGWSAVENLVGVTPSTTNQPLIDNPGIINVTFFYTGPVVSGDAVIKGFQITSSLKTINANGAFSSQSTKTGQFVDGQTDQLVGPVAVPTIAIATPEPASLAFAGIGLAGLLALRKRLVS
jgi:PEP-CTERM motif